MTTTWADIETDMPSVIQAAAADANLQVEWEHTTAVFRDDLYVDLSFVSIAGAGRDERRGTVNAEDITERVYGVRLINIQIKVDSQDQPFNALEVASKIKAGLYSQAVRDLLVEMGLGLSTVSDPRYVPYRSAHDRMRGSAVLEAVFNADTTVTLPAIPFVDRVSGDSPDLGLSFDTE